MTYIRIQNITNSSGRMDYLTNPERQEHILSTITSHDQSIIRNISNFEKARKTGKVEAKEMVIAIPSELHFKTQTEFANFQKEVAKNLLNDDTIYLAAVHKSTKNGVDNIHMHLMFFERYIDKQGLIPQTYKRDVWLKKDGTLAKSKAERHELIHKKGEPKLDDKGNILYEKKEVTFTKKDRYYHNKDFLFSSVEKYSQILKKHGVELKENHFNHMKLGHKTNNEWYKMAKEYNNIVKQANLNMSKIVEFYGHDFAQKVEKITKSKSYKSVENIRKINDNLQDLVNLRSSFDPNKKEKVELLKNLESLEHLLNEKQESLEKTQKDLKNAPMFDFKQKKELKIKLSKEQKEVDNTQNDLVNAKAKIRFRESRKDLFHKFDYDDLLYRVIYKPKDLPIAKFKYNKAKKELDKFFKKPDKFNSLVSNHERKSYYNPDKFNNQMQIINNSKKTRIRFERREQQEKLKLSLEKERQIQLQQKKENLIKAISTINPDLRNIAIQRTAEKKQKEQKLENNRSR